MKAQLTQNYLARIKATGKGFWVTDVGCKNLRLYVGARGAKTWYVSYWKDDKKQSRKLGSADALTVIDARKDARDFLARLDRGEEPEKKKVDKKIQLGEFIETYYRPWVETNRKTGKATIAMLCSSFQFLFNQPIEELRKYEIEEWRTKRQNEGTKAASINRLMTALKAVLNWGVDQELLKFNPLNRVKPLQEIDSEERTRYLSDNEVVRLMDALNAREARMISERNSHNKWLKERGKEPFPSYGEGEFVDYLKPMVIVALNTGMRRGNLFALVWGDVDFDNKVITLRDTKTKNSSKAQHIRMNDTLTSALTVWFQQSADISPDALVFPSTLKAGARMVSVRRSWGKVLKDAQIENCRWHDLRHDFASQLVMEGADLYAVSKALGHTNVKTTQRYAHLSPETQLKVVELLDKKKRN